jgi:hypothetical protein
MDQIFILANISIRNTSPCVIAFLLSLLHNKTNGLKNVTAFFYLVNHVELGLVTNGLKLLLISTFVVFVNMHVT